MTSVLASNLKVLRKQSNLSQDEFAEILGISRSKVSSYENKNIEPRLFILVKMAEHFDITVDDLVKTKITLDNIEEIRRKEKESQNGEDRNSSEIFLKLEDEDIIEDYIKKNVSIQKMLEGFKIFYNLKVKEQSEETDPAIREVEHDIDNVLYLIEYLLNHNKSLISAIKAQMDSND